VHPERRRAGRLRLPALRKGFDLVAARRAGRGSGWRGPVQLL